MSPPYCPDDPGLAQRFILSLLYFSTNGDMWLDDFGFLSGIEECDQVVCDAHDRVVQIGPDDNNVAGTIPTEIALLPRLLDLDLDGNNTIGGIIPDEQGNLNF